MLLLKFRAQGYLACKIASEQRYKGSQAVGTALLERDSFSRVSKAEDLEQKDVEHT